MLAYIKVTKRTLRSLEACQRVAGHMANLQHI